MESDLAVRRLSALAQANRLEVFRLLVKAGPDGIPAGEIARTLSIAPNTLSAQLNLLSSAGLVKNRRE
ncbi:MAG: helix-turn-helix domain-containing protein, partial [Alphaproteobacteria bacterium]|nr:helix-turn-helix domain-containing protein [Alphaproteobacteria bacterium]